MPVFNYIVEQLITKSIIFEIKIKIKLKWEINNLRSEFKDRILNLLSFLFCYLCVVLLR